MKIKILKGYIRHYGIQQIFYDPRWMLRNIKVICLVWYFINIYQIKCYYVADVLEEPTNDVKKAYQIYDKAYNDNDLHEDLLANIQEEFSYCIAPDFTFT